MHPSVALAALGVACIALVQIGGVHAQPNYRFPYNRPYRSIDDQDQADVSRSRRAADSEPNSWGYGKTWSSGAALSNDGTGRIEPKYDATRPRRAADPEPNSWSYGKTWSSGAALSNDGTGRTRRAADPEPNSWSYGKTWSSGAGLSNDATGRIEPKYDATRPRRAADPEPNSWNYGKTWSSGAGLSNDGTSHTEPKGDASRSRRAADPQPNAWQKSWGTIEPSNAGRGLGGFPNPMNKLPQYLNEWSNDLMGRSKPKKAVTRPRRAADPEPGCDPRSGYCPFRRKSTKKTSSCPFKNKSCSRRS